MLSYFKLVVKTLLVQSKWWDDYYKLSGRLTDRHRTIGTTIDSALAPMPDTIRYSYAVVLIDSIERTLHTAAYITGILSHKTRIVT